MGLPVGENHEMQPRYYLYDDLAYWPAFGIMGPHRQQDPAVPLSRAEESANLVMSSARIAMECGFASSINYWGINGYRKGTKLGSSPVAAYYMISTLLANFHTCLKGRKQVSDKFKIKAPSLEEYVRSVL